MNESDQELSSQELKEIESASQRAQRVGDPAADVRQWLLENFRATLCTTAAKPLIAGHPFGSIVPFAIDRYGRPYLMIAEIAAHTANLRQDSRAALMVSDPEAAGDPQASWRITLIGSMKRILAEGSERRFKSSAVQVSQDEYDDMHRRYVERVPQADGYIKQHDFSYWRMEEIVSVRYIAGFGRICWVEGQDILREPLGGGLESAAQPAVDHMNEDHHDNMIEMCQGLYGFSPKSAKMFGLDATGFHVATQEPERSLFFSFEREIDAKSLRVAVIDVLKRARAAIRS
jgi:hypothetical protein